MVYVPSKRRIKLPDIPGIINAVTAMNPEKNKYKRFTSTNSLEGKRYRKLQIKIESVNHIEIKKKITELRKIGMKKFNMNTQEIAYLIFPISIKKET